MSVPVLKGGGTRTVSVEDDSNVQDLVKIRNPFSSLIVRTFLVTSQK